LVKIWASAAVLALAMGDVHAASLVEGRYLTDAFAPPATGQGGEAARADDAGRLDLGGLKLSFTPRAAFTHLSDSAALPADAPTLRLNLSDPTGETQRLELLNIVPRHLSGLDLGGPGVTEGGFVAGGALAFGEFSVGGSVLRSTLGQSQTQLFGADLGYGRMNARLAFGQTDAGGDASEREFWLFSTNLAARPWLSLEGDVGYRPSQSTEPANTMGRIGVRLRF